MSFASKRERKLRVVTLALAASVAVALWAFPKLQATWKERELVARVERLNLAALDTAEEAQELVSLRVQRFGSLLNSWETIGGCGAGSSVGGGTIKWIGRSTRGGLFNLQWLTTYTPVRADLNISGGYNLSNTLQLTRDVGDKWNFGVVVPYLYKYYRDYYGVVTNNRAVDVSNAGFGDVNVLATRRFGDINATSLTLAIGLPTGTYDAAYRNNVLTQEKQLGLGRFTGTLTLDHTFDEIWGLIVAGAAIGYRGGENNLGNYRSPVGSIYVHGAYFLGPLVPAIGLNFTRFWEPDRSKTVPQDMALNLLAPSASLEWSNDYIALLLGGTLPFAVPSFKTQPWVVGLGLSASPF